VTSAPSIIDQPWDVNLRLQQLGPGLNVQVLLGAVEVGTAAYAGTTANHPPFFGGMWRFAEIVRNLREELLPEGWGRSDRRNFSTVLSPDRRVAIAVAQGDESTGDADKTPTTRYAKGVTVQEAVDGNRLLPFYEVDDLADSELEPQLITWILLHSRVGDAVRVELSRPAVIDGSGFVQAWDERLIIGSVELNPTRMSVPDSDPVVPIVEIRRRNG
jgi:hypothetical protein